MTLLLDSIFSSVAWGHLIVDVLNGQRTVLLTFWSNELGMSNTMLALVTTIYIWVASLSQPVFGWITDRFSNARWMAAGGILWMTGLFGLALFLPIQASIPCLILASLGSAAFHPVGTMQATLRGRMRLAGQETTAASWFFLFGQFGYFFGPIIGGPLLDLFGPVGLLILAAPALVIGLNAAWQLRLVPRPVLDKPKPEAELAFKTVTGKYFLLVLALVAALQAWAQQNMITFMPKYLSDLGKPASIYGLFAGIFMGGSAIGNVIGGNLADRFSKRRVAMIMLTLASIPLVLISLVGWSPWLYLLVPLAGACTGAVHSIIVVLAQRTIRSGMALASGLILGFMFSAGALGTLISGWFADVWGFPPVFQVTSGLVLLAAFLTIFLREKKKI
jgi:FSR family fosmidomycin resistance protein-like MFS transporter